MELFISKPPPPHPFLLFIPYFITLPTRTALPIQSTHHHSISTPSDSPVEHTTTVHSHNSIQFPQLTKEHSGKTVLPCPYSLRVYYKDVRCRRKGRVKAY